LSYNAIIAAATGSPIVGCTGLNRAKNGIQIFPGAGTDLSRQYTDRCRGCVG